MPLFPDCSPTTEPPPPQTLNLDPKETKGGLNRVFRYCSQKLSPYLYNLGGFPGPSRLWGARGSLQVWSESHLLYPYNFRTSPQICPPNYRKEGMTSWGESWAVLGQIRNNPTQKLRKHVSGMARESQNQCIAHRSSRYPTHIPLVGSLQGQIPIWINNYQTLRLFEKTPAARIWGLRDP